MVLRNCAGLLTVSTGFGSGCMTLLCSNQGTFFYTGLLLASKHLTSEDTWIWTLISETIVVQMWIPT